MNWKLFFLLCSVFFVCTATYLIVPLLPIYFTETISRGGLEWSKNETFSLYGTFLAFLYIAPFFGGLFGDFVFGKSISGLLGYGLIVTGLCLLSEYPASDLILLTLLSLALGFGFVKVNLTATFGSLPQDIRQKVYDYYYLAACFGFICGGLLSYPIFIFFAITGVLKASLGSTLISLAFFGGFFGKKIFFRLKSDGAACAVTSGPLSTNPYSFFTLIVLSIPFFICAHQLTTGIPIFLHQFVNRTVGGRSIPALWFGAIGSFIMAILSPWFRRYWNAHDTSSNMKGILKLSVGFGLVGFSLACTAIWATIGSSVAVPVVGIVVLLCSNAMSCIADFHVRPVLFASATTLMPLRYHILSTGLVYFCIGLAGKLAGTLVSFVDSFGFTLIFGTCSLAAILCSFASYLWWKKAHVSATV